jgi:hypothetical protein
MRLGLATSARRIAGTLAALAAMSSAASAQVTITFFETHPTTPPDPTLPYPGGAVICTATAAGTATGFSLNFGDPAQRALFCPSNPDRISPSFSFGARVTGSLIAATTGTYSGLTINADDGDRLTVNGNIIRTDWVDKGGGPGNVGSINLNAGANPFVFDYYQGPCCGAFLELAVTGGVTVTPPVTAPAVAPEPGSLVLTATGLGVAAAGAGRRRRRAA